MIVLLFLMATLSVDGQQTIPCDATYMYRSFDGTCGNLTNPLLGSAGSAYIRMFPASYSDGVGVVRKSISGSELTSARMISSTVLNSESHPVNNHTLIVMQWGQFIAHDLVQTEKRFNGYSSGIQCCTQTQLGDMIDPNQQFVDPECLPIRIPNNDLIYNSLNESNTKTCMNFFRSQFHFRPNSQNNTSPPETAASNREQRNTNTHWLDGSQIYGSNPFVAASLRNPSLGTGQMMTSLDKSGRVLLPLINTSKCCPFFNPCPAADKCFSAGDDRLGQHPTLMTMHTIWLREHNRVAKKLVDLLPGRSDEFYFQQARRIVIAQLQHITYTKYLPLIIGATLAKKVNSNRNTNGNVYFGSQTESDDPSIFTEFNTAAFRFGHSQIKNMINLYEADGRLSEQSFSLAHSLEDSGGPFFPDRQGFLTASFLDNSLRGLISKSPVETVDISFADDIHSKLFRLPGAALGLDLAAINIQRGRDHGIPPYANASDPNPDSFDSLLSVIPQKTIDLLEDVYASVFDIDLFVGGISERPLPGALIGPTFAKMIALQFRNLKLADRFFYDDISQSVSFTKKQLAEIQKVTLARIICDNNDGTISKIQSNVFKEPSPTNLLVSCNDIPGINFSVFSNLL